MPKIVVTNLPVTAYINAEVDVADGPPETLNSRIAQAVAAGRWARARGARAQELGENELGDLTLEAEVGVRSWSSYRFDVAGPAGPGRVWDPTFGRIA